MTITITDPALLAALKANAVVSFCEADGSTLGHFTADASEPIPARLEGKLRFLTPEERARREAAGPGRSLKEIQRDLLAKYPCSK